MTATTNDGFTQTTATGGETTIDFDFLIYGKDDIAFYETDLSGVITLLVRGTDYSIADSELNDPTGGEIVLDPGQYPSGATAGHKFTCISDIGETRAADFQQGGDFFAQTLNTNLDRLTRVTQQLRRDVDKAARLKVDSLVASVTFTDDPQDGYGIVWDGVLGNFRNTASSIAVLEGNAAIVAANIASVNTVAGSIANVNTVAGAIANVNTVAGIAGNVTTVAGISANVTTVAGISAAVSTVATNAAAVSTCATNIAAIIAAPGFATEAEHWAQYPEDSLVPEGNGVNEYSAYHWAQKAAAVAVGNGAALSLLGVAGNAVAARADIVAANDGEVMRRSGTSIGFGAVNLAQSAAVTGILPTANGGTANAFFTVSGPATSAKTFTFPNASATVLTTNAAVTVAQGGTGVASTTAYAVLCGGTTSTGALQSVASVGTAGQVLTSNGAAALPTFQTLPGSGLVLLAVATASNSATLDFTSVMSSTYDQYVLVFDHLVMATDATSLMINFSTNNGSTWINTGATYSVHRLSLTAASGTALTENTGGSDNLTLRFSSSVTLDNVADSALCGFFELYTVTGKRQKFTYNFAAADNASNMGFSVGGGQQTGTTIVNALRVLSSSGNITSGVVRLYGVRKTV